jgi:nucleotidyltransferase substrate binding protein (TIGR01987 family)
MNEELRWVQRFNNFSKALDRLDEAVQQNRLEQLSILEREGLVQRFEYTHEFAWKVLKDYLEYQGVTSIVGSRDATRLAFTNGLIDDGEVWMDMIQSRNLTSHTYDEELAEDISEKIIELYHPALLSFKQKMITRNIDS